MTRSSSCSSSARNAVCVCACVCVQRCVCVCVCVQRCVCVCATLCVFVAPAPCWRASARVACIRPSLSGVHAVPTSAPWVRLACMHMTGAEVCLHARRAWRGRGVAAAAAASVGVAGRRPARGVVAAAQALCASVPRWCCLHGCWRPTPPAGARTPGAQRRARRGAVAPWRWRARARCAAAAGTPHVCAGTRLHTRARAQPLCGVLRWAGRRPRIGAPSRAPHAPRGGCFFFFAVRCVAAGTPRCCCCCCCCVARACRSAARACCCCRGAQAGPHLRRRAMRACIALVVCRAAPRRTVSALHSTVRIVARPVAV
jgi:hypothetical protein